MNVKYQKTASILQNLSAKFFQNQQFFENGILTVTVVDVSSDKNNVVVWLGLQGVSEVDFAKKVQKIEPQLRHYISKESKLRYTPVLKVKVDNSIDAGIKIQKLLGLN